MTLPAPLKRPLTFGDTEQIAALKLLAADDDAEFPTDVPWEVTYTVERTSIVYATSKSEAEEEIYEQELEHIDEILSIHRIQEQPK